MLLLLCRAPGAGAQTGQEFKLHQPQDKVSVRAGETLTLNCTVSGAFEPGPVKWLKGWGSDNKTIYGETVTYPRVTRAANESNTDFTIHIRNVQPEDIGTYYCVKFQILLTGGIEVLQHGSGTEVSVHVSPSVDVRAEQMSPIQLNKTVNFTCHVKGFYPPDVSVSWLENGMKMEVEKNNSWLSLSCKYLFELRSWVEVQATEEKNGSVFTCLVVHDAQAPVNYSTTLWIASPFQEGSSVIFLSSLLLLLFGILLEKVLLSGLLFFLFKHMKLNMLGMVPCPAPSQSPVPPDGSQGLVTTSHL
ncbi:Tyrosine-protein phosphatase non-receptor type substrate 1 [Willisornis vidua]|uniref:Tyrosine-protein phosphatase non-receptor type substrate 1 n=1 Tax=Willisornis vidua TaxID=1566151 RepID=A0ABQ9DXX4_9PASS|nr:Tyrosine-protein phosphatase non-receptor type substrate 1 [Willisornis vidua]